jgi:hypothetical protein
MREGAWGLIKALAGDVERSGLVISTCEEL